MNKMVKYVIIGGLWATLMFVLWNLTTLVQAGVDGEINCTVTHQEVEAINHVAINWTCTESIQGWVSVGFDDGSSVDVWMDGNSAGTDHWYGYMVGYTTIYTVYVNLPNGQSFGHVVIIDDSPDELDCQTKVVNGETHNHKLISIECDQPTSGWAHFDFGDGSGTDVWVQWLPELGISWAYAEHWYAFDLYVTEVHNASITYEDVTYPLEVEINQVLWGTYLPLITR